MFHQKVIESRFLVSTLHLIQNSKFLFEEKVEMGEYRYQVSV